jgi:hypothetical protein
MLEDIDQLRAEDVPSSINGLPNNGGMYFVPTAAVNWMAYIANHGYPNTDPGRGFWEVSPPQYLTEYNHITGNLFSNVVFDGNKSRYWNWKCQKCSAILA